MVSNNGTEVIVGLSRDPQFGPTVIFGLGGIFVEALRDVVLRVAPLSQRDAEAMVWGIKGSRVLKEFRGRPPADTDALIKLLLRVSTMAVDLQDHLQELDLNPVIVFEQGAGLKVIDALAVLSEARS
jgi:acetyltransferase